MKVSKEVVILSSCIATLQFLDAGVSYYGLERWGVTIEGNPLQAYLMRHIGLLPALVISKLSVLLGLLSLVYVTLREPKNERLVLNGLYICLGCYVPALAMWISLILSHR